MKSNIDDKIRIIVLVCGIIFFVVGIIMMIVGISAEGSIDIRSVLVSGKLHTGSAGLFIIFFAFLLILFAMLQKPPSPPTMQAEMQTSHPILRILINLFALFLILFIIFIIGAIGIGGDVFLGLLLFFGAMILILLCAVLIYLVHEYRKLD